MGGGALHRRGAPMSERALVTGGGGFVGRRIVELLLARGDEVSFLARSRYPEVEALGATGHAVDLADPDQLRAIARGKDVVYHVAGKAGFWGPEQDYIATNVVGTHNVIDACRSGGVGRLVYTSTPSVIGYAHDAVGISDAPYPNAWESPYGRTKAAAEQLVRAANGPDLKTVALRPHLVIGPGDHHLLPRVIARAKAGRLRIIGDGTNRVDLTYVDNVAWAHLDAADALNRPGARCAGRAYFISNDEPVVLWTWTNDVLAQLGVPPVTGRIGLSAARGIGAACELVWGGLGLRSEPPMTRFLAVALARTHYYSMEPARTDLGYTVRVPMAEATAATVAWFSAQEGR